MGVVQSYTGFTQTGLCRLMVRVGLRALRKILPHTTDEQQVVGNIFKKLSKAASKQPSKVNGECIFFKSLVE
eukprot:9933279-Lingulodinium_polyedra.AAC.1